MNIMNLLKVYLIKNLEKFNKISIKNRQFIYKIIYFF
jgi:hypothetical protein